MVNAGVEPNLVTYTALISACVNAGDMDDAKRLFGALEVTTTVFSDVFAEITKRLVFGAFCRGDSYFQNFLSC